MSPTCYAPEHLSLQIATPTRWSRRDRQCRRGVRRRLERGDVRRLCLRPEPRAAHRRRGAGLERGQRRFVHESVNVQTLDRAGARALAGAAARLARLEGLEAHARAAEIRGA